MTTPRVLHWQGHRYVRADLATPPAKRQLTLTFRFPTATAAEAFWPALQPLAGESTVTTRGALAIVVCDPELGSQVAQIAQQHQGVPADTMTGRAE